LGYWLWKRNKTVSQTNREWFSGVRYIVSAKGNILWREKMSKMEFFKALVSNHPVLKLKSKSLYMVLSYSKFFDINIEMHPTYLYDFSKGSPYTLCIGWCLICQPKETLSLYFWPRNRLNVKSYIMLKKIFRYLKEKVYTLYSWNQKKFMEITKLFEGFWGKIVNNLLHCE